MANNSAGSSVKLLWAGKQVRIEEVETALSALWKMSADNMRIGANLHVRTSVLNLVICTPDIESAHNASKLLRELSSIHLARATIIVLDQGSGAPDTLTSWITLRCFSMISDLMRHCFEQTTILVSRRHTRALQGTLSTVLKAHLPVYLWWLGETGSDGAFQTVARMCQRAIIDSATFVHPEEDLQALARYCQSAPEVAISDLNWGRLTLWRQLVAQFFDVSEYLPFLAGVDSIEIAYAADSTAPPDPTAALLLAGWLKARLQLSLAAEHRPAATERSGETYHWLLLGASAASHTLLQIEPHHQAELHPGSIYLVRLTCKAAKSQAIFTIRRSADSNHVLTSVESVQQPYPMRTVNLPARHEHSDLLRKELEIMVHDPFFEQTLQELALLIEGAEQART